jgi:hypothetical protein
LFREPAKLFDPGIGVSKRLFDEDGNPSSDASDGLWDMQVRGRADQSGLRLQSQAFLETGYGGPADFLRQRDGAGGVCVQGDDPAVPGGGIPRMAASDASATKDKDIHSRPFD